MCTIISELFDVSNKLPADPIWHGPSASSGNKIADSRSRAWFGNLSYKCSAQSRNGYNSGIVPAQSRNSHFAGRSKNSYLARFNSGIVLAQSRNRDKVRIYYFPAQSRNRGQSKNICVIIIIIIILFYEHYD